jgi:hypothetical protein
LLGCWFIVERARERAFSSLRRGHFCRSRACIQRLLSSTEIEAESTALNAGHTVRIEQAVQKAKQAQKSRQGTVRVERSYCTDFRIPYSKKEKKARKPRQKVQSVLYGFHIVCTVRTTVIQTQKSRLRRCAIF